VTYLKRKSVLISTKLLPQCCLMIVSRPSPPQSSFKLCLFYIQPVTNILCSQSTGVFPSPFQYACSILAERLLFMQHFRHMYWIQQSLLKANLFVSVFKGTQSIIVLTVLSTCANYSHNIGSHSLLLTHVHSIRARTSNITHLLDALERYSNYH